jgi:hypothetical protein
MNDFSGNNRLIEKIEDALRNGKTIYIRDGSSRRRRLSKDEKIKYEDWITAVKKSRR